MADPHPSAGPSAGRRAAPHQRLYINIDHVATVRQARRTDEPDPVAAASLCEDAGADGITAHLREDRRHIQDADVEGLARTVRTVFNLEMAATGEMLAIATRLRPHQVTLVPERREEITTEGGLDVTRDQMGLRAILLGLRAAGIRTSLFIDADERMVHRSRDLGVDAIELHTGRYAHHADDREPLAALDAAARLGAELGLAVHAGHGLTVRNVAPVAAIPEIEELNIGHSIVSRAIFVGLAESVREMRDAMDRARAPLAGAVPADRDSR
jgi:pyridoxine 5-phosphate synthase